MKILYNQNKNETSALASAGISGCYLKYIASAQAKSATSKMHHHTFFEVHIIIEGFQVYEIENETIKLNKGSLLFISPSVPHRVTDISPNLCKFAVCFGFAAKTEKKFFRFELSDDFKSGLHTLLEESSVQTEFSTSLSEFKIGEIIIKLLRAAGCNEQVSASLENENTLLALAKQYITDNIERSPSVSEIASYCGISTRQLARIFEEFENITPKEFITREKIKRISELILDERFTLRQISERMGFGNEYYFNSFFKKYFGLPPSNYRKMHGK